MQPLDALQAQRLQTIGVVDDVPRAPVPQPTESCGNQRYRVLKGPGASKWRGCSWGTLRIPFGKIGEP